LGWLFAAITGAILPFFFFFIGPIFDSFGGDPDAFAKLQALDEEA